LTLNEPLIEGSIDQSMIDLHIASQNKINEAENGPKTGDGQLNSEKKEQTEVSFL